MAKVDVGKLGETVTETVLTTTTAALPPGATAAGVAVAGLIAFAPYFVGAVIPRYLDRKHREVSDWWESVVMENGTDIGAKAEIEARASEPAVEEVVVSAFKVILEALTPDVIPAVGLLTREYARTGAPRDAFFIGMAAVLREVTGAEYKDLRALVSWLVQSAPPGRQWVDAHHVAPSLSPSLPDYEFLELGRASDDEVPVRTPAGFPLGNVRRLFALLKRAGLATDAPSGPLGATSGPGVLEYEVEMLKRVRGMLGVPLQPAG